ncbi:ATP-binding protein [Algoriphagus sp. H41]|uniref:ATP-binding protein n=1 Tax=Algoriphagus oliviformis TaxID=2811231 RepID=A0ABS3C626_9BACT|nr:ATP-binding protein [Algoriphagus oliviformis]MBN7812572.1 ATP-binding protein [Algoriphagus oliviformis]
MTQEEKLKKASSVFSPAAPIETRDLFFGRIEQFQKLNEAINERGMHSVIYGDRGVGKTSLANIASLVYKGVTVSKVTCNRTEDFKSIWQKALNKVSFNLNSKKIGFTAKSTPKTIQLDLFLPEKETIDSKDIESVLSNLDNKLLFIFDEFDSITNTDVKTRMADTIKLLSDNMPNITILIVGIALDVNELIGHHPSVERCLLQIYTPRMSNSELGEIIDGGLAQIGIKINSPQRKKIIEFSTGFPSFTHLLCKHAAIHCLQSNKSMIDKDDLDFAIDKALENSAQSIKNAYQIATLSSKSETLFSEVLFALASSEVDQFGFSSKRDILDSLFNLSGKNYTSQRINYYINDLCSESRGKVIEKIGEKNNVRFRFRNPMIKSFILMKMSSNKSNKK